MGDGSRKRHLHWGMKHSERRGQDLGDTVHVKAEPDKLLVLCWSWVMIMMLSVRTS